MQIAVDGKWLHGELWCDYCCDRQSSFSVASSTQRGGSHANWVPAGRQPRIIESNMGGMLLGKVEPDKNRGGVYRHFSTDEAVAFYE